MAQVTWSYFEAAGPQARGEKHQDRNGWNGRSRNADGFKPTATALNATYDLTAVGRLPTAPRRATEGR